MAEDTQSTAVPPTAASVPVARDAANMDGKLLECFKVQVEGCRKLGSPFTAMVCELLAERLDRTTRFGRRILDWPGHPSVDALPLRATGGLHALARSGRSPHLTAAYPPHAVDREDLWRVLRAVMMEQDEFLCGYLDGPPQTNEVARSGVILGGCLLIAAATRLPLTIFEIGASAGLNLAFDRYRYDLGGESWGDEASPVRIRCEWSGEAPALDTPLKVAARGGCDQRPLKPALPVDRERLLSYIWPDQGERLARTAAALDVAAASPWRVARADAGDWVVRHLAKEPVPGRTRVLMHTIVWQYLPKNSKAYIEAALGAAGARSSREHPLAWLRMEYDGSMESAAMKLTLWPGGTEYRLGDADYHGRWVRWAGVSPTLP